MVMNAVGGLILLTVLMHSLYVTILQAGIVYELFKTTLDDPPLLKFMHMRYITILIQNEAMGAATASDGGLRP